MPTNQSARVTILPDAVPATLPCVHKKDGMCDACIMWAGITSGGWIDPRFWRSGKGGDYVVTVTCLDHGIMGKTVEVAADRDPFDCLNKASHKLLHGGRLSCRCKVSILD